LHSLELRQPMDRGIGKGHGDVGADCAVVLMVSLKALPSIDLR
jgi:hypothetical protein